MQRKERDFVPNEVYLISNSLFPATEDEIPYLIFWDEAFTVIIRNNTPDITKFNDNIIREELSEERGMFSRSLEKEQLFF